MIHVSCVEPRSPGLTAWMLAGCGGAVSVRSDPDAARAFLARRHSDVPLEPVERRLETSPDLRGLFDDWDRARAERVLARLGFELLTE
jgi:hypothetical protein